MEKYFIFEYAFVCIMNPKNSHFFDLDTKYKKNNAVEESLIETIMVLKNKKV